jgi:hypothetical protein
MRDEDDERHPDEHDDEGRRDEREDESLIDRMRGSGVGVEDPDIVGDPHPGVVDAEIAADEPPQV